MVFYEESKTSDEGERSNMFSQTNGAISMFIAGNVQLLYYLSAFLTWFFLSQYFFMGCEFKKKRFCRNKCKKMQ